MQGDHLKELKKLQSYKEDPDKLLNLEDLFELSEVGCNGDLKIAPRGIKKRLERHNCGGLSRLPNDLPPIFPSNDELDLEEYLVHPEKLPIHHFCESQRFWPRKQNLELLFNASYSPVLTTLKVERNSTTGQLLGYKEVAVLNADSTGKNSTSLLRHPDPQNSEVKGNSTNIPFRPGGLEETNVNNSKNEETTTLNFETNLLCIPPGFSQKIAFNKNASDDICEASVVNIADILSSGVSLDDEIEENEENIIDNQPIEDEVDSSVQDSNSDELKRSDSLEKLFDQNKNRNEEDLVETSVLEEENNQDWAVMVNVKEPVKDFRTKIPDMAKKFKFELDTFQKQAVIHLENKECVFVAAHTSAGKTVVAEYAIALASKHMTKTIYTSPIKALSNQKFRDFKDTFESVGLITGDVQISPEASCLVMTTEILRSMLYRGSRVIRDTEWVIFDEVHYVNDAERGVVWEEVLIMLPDHVNIIMLSATVPNTKEFAGWVGRIKKKKIYVISTTKRPVPLEYFLYTGNSKKTSNELFQIVNTTGKFLDSGYKKAIDAKSQRSSKNKETTGPKGPRYNARPNEERNVWVSLVRKLEENEGLPVVAFTFSRTRCNENANRLTSLDLTTSKEKHEIHIFIQKCVSRLKCQDAQLPQVKQMQELLGRGLAVHHSGILPIIKEMIEMLFQRGLVKLLFATETFAMGVNMPARTVVFDSIRKHDGTKFRDLLPGEFIQMAGRAGRRGIDNTGTVIILCKADVPEISDLQKMMLGKPTLLESRFRLTYSMILNLLRSEDLCVEDMMKRSFAEFHLLKNAPECERMKKEIKSQLENFSNLRCPKCESDIKDYYEICKEHAKLKKSVQFAMVSSLNGQKALSPGRVIVVNNSTFGNVLGIIVYKKSPYSSTDSARSKKSYQVFIIYDTNEVVWTESNCSEKDIVKPYVRDMKIVSPERPCGHAIIDVIENDIIVITDQVIKVKTEAIISDYNNRQIPRFRNNPPGESVTLATEELLRISERRNTNGLPALDIVIKDAEFIENVLRLKMLESRLEYFECVGCLTFHEHFEKYREKRVLCDKLDDLDNKSSLERLSLIPQYRARKKVLNELGYLKEDVVEMIGLVACEINNHELVISGLLLDNFFHNLEPAEIVALLSCFVFEQRKCSEPKFTENLQKGKEIIEQAAKNLAKLEQKHEMDTSLEEFVKQFKFGLVEVVYEWAKGMPFYEITQLTDVQEGIIVRCIQRLNELCQDVKNAAKRLGVVEVQEKMETASSLLKRDIVFAASLYTQ